MHKRFIILTILSVLYAILAEVAAWGYDNHWHVNPWLLLNVQAILFTGGLGLPLAWAITCFITYDD